MKFVCTNLVIRKVVKPYTKPDGTTTNYYNLTLADPDNYTNIVCSVREELYNSVDINKSYTFAGSFGGLGSKRWWSIDGLVNINRII